MSTKGNVPVAPHQDLGEIAEIVCFDTETAILVADIVCIKRHENKNCVHLRNGQFFVVYGGYAVAVRKWKAAILAGQS